MEVVRLKVLATGTLALALLIGAGYLPSDTGWPVLAAVLLLLAALGVGWPRLLKVPSPNPVGLVIFLVSALGAVLAFMARPMPGLPWLAPVVGIGAIVMFLTQLFRGTDAQGRLESVASGVAGLVVAAMGAGWVALGTVPDGRDLAVIGGLAVLAAAIPGVLRLPDRIVFPLGFVLAVLVGGAGSILGPGVDLVPGLALGAACGLVIVGSRAMLVTSGGPRGSAQMLAAGLAPLMVCGAVIWFARLLMV